MKARLHPKATWNKPAFFEVIDPADGYQSYGWVGVVRNRRRHRRVCRRVTALITRKSDPVYWSQAVTSRGWLDVQTMELFDMEEN